MSFQSRLLLSSAFALLVLTACSQEKTNQSAPVAASAPHQEIAATVNGAPIDKKEVDMILKQQRGMPDTPETRKMIVDNIALQMLLSQEAEKKGLDKTDDASIQLNMAKQAVLAQVFVQDYLNNTHISDAQLNAEYEKLKAQASANQYKARHILVKTEDEAKAIIAKLNKDPKAFDALAKAESLDPGSKSKGGDLGWFETRSMVPEFSEALAKLEKGKFTETPVKSQFGYHVIMLDDTRPSTATVPPLDQLKANLTQQLQQQNLRKMLDDMKAKAKIDIVAAAPASTPAATPSASTPAPTATPIAPPLAPEATPAAEAEKK
jgi:peptidyl-prolyl cis-trans isomerase C